MTLTPEQIQKPYQLIDQIKHSDLMPFVKEQLKRKNWSAVGYKVLAVGTAIPLVYLLIMSHAYQIKGAFNWFSYGMAVTFALVPLHEYIHALTYRLCGAKQTSYQAQWTKFYFMALADRFVASKKEFTWVALAPFAVISLVCITLTIGLDGGWKVLFAGVLFTHTAMCGGDFAMLSFLEHYWKQDPITYDDLQTASSYFYIKEPDAPQSPEL